MLKSEYQRMNERINPDPELTEKVMRNAMPRRKGYVRSAVAIAAMLVLVLMATPVMADCMPWILEHIAPELAEELDPVQRSDTDNGITMEVVAASIHGNVAELVVKLESELLVEPVGVAPFLEASTTGFTKTTIHSILDYEGGEADRASGIYYYQVKMIYRDNIPVEEILSGEMTVTLSNLLINGFASEEIAVPVILTEEDQITMTHVSALKNYGFSSFGWGSDDGYEGDEDLEKYVMMPPGEYVYHVTDDLALSCAAYIDGKLHVQMAAVDMNGGDPEWGYMPPYFVDSQGNRVTYLYRNLFGIEDGTHRIDYEERVYDIPEQEVDNYTMMMRLQYYDMILANCEVTFQFSESDIVTE